MLARSRRNSGTSVEVTDRYILLRGRGRRRRNRNRIILRNNADEINHHSCCCHDHWNHHGVRPLGGRRGGLRHIPRIFNKQDDFVDVIQNEASDLNEPNSLYTLYGYNDKTGYWSKNVAKRNVLQDNRDNWMVEAIDKGVKSI